MATWDTRKWLSGVSGIPEEELAVRSVDRYGDRETQVRYEQAGEAVARVTVVGPVREMLQREGEGRWEIKAQIGSGTSDVHTMTLPETEEITY
jgi:hypothetical protein